jgi:hypothetical protein
MLAIAKPKLPPPITAILTGYGGGALAFIESTVDFLDLKFVECHSLMIELEVPTKEVEDGLLTENASAVFDHIDDTEKYNSKMCDNIITRIQYAGIYLSLSPSQLFFSA